MSLAEHWRARNPCSMGVTLSRYACINVWPDGKFGWLASCYAWKGAKHSP